MYFYINILNLSKIFHYSSFLYLSTSEDLRTEQMRPMFRTLPEVTENYPHVYDSKFTKLASKYFSDPHQFLISLIVKLFSSYPQRFINKITRKRCSEEKQSVR